MKALSDDAKDKLRPLFTEMPARVWPRPADDDPEVPRVLKMGAPLPSRGLSLSAARLRTASLLSMSIGPAT